MIVYMLLGIILIICLLILIYVIHISMDLCSIMAHTERTYDIITRWAIFNVIEEHHKGNNSLWDFIFPDDREKIEKKMNNENK